MEGNGRAVPFSPLICKVLLSTRLINADVDLDYLTEVVLSRSLILLFSFPIPCSLKESHYAQPTHKE